MVCKEKVMVTHRSSDLLKELKAGVELPLREEPRRKVDVAQVKAYRKDHPEASLGSCESC